MFLLVKTAVDRARKAFGGVTAIGEIGDWWCSAASDSKKQQLVNVQCMHLKIAFR